MNDTSFKSDNAIPFRPRNSIIGPDGSVLTTADLPPPNTTRWIARRKAEVVAAVQGGLLSRERACLRYNLSLEEFLEWERHYESEGVPGLRVSARLRAAKPSLN